MVGAVTDRKVELSWQNPNLNRNFVVHLFKDDGTQEINQTVPNLPSIATVIQDLMSDSTYVIVVEDSLTLTVLGSLQAMTNVQPNSNVRVDSKTSTSVVLSWNLIPFATNYRISYISQDNAGTGVLSSTIPTSVVTGLQPQMTYAFSVVATVGTSRLNVGTVAVIIDATLSGSVNVSNLTPTTVSLQWTLFPGNVIYEIVYTGPDGNPTTVSSVSNGASLINLSPGTPYSIRVQVRDSTGITIIGTTSITTPVTSDTTPPAVMCPPDVNRVLESGNSVLIDVGQPIVSDNSGSVELVSSTLPAGNQFSIGTTMVTFTYRDPANNRASCSLFVLISQVTPIIVKEVTPTTATLSWTTVPGVIAYDIIFTGQNNFQRSVTSPTEWVFMANLSPGLPYNARVVANVASPGGQVEVGMTSFNTSQPNSVTVTGVTTSTAILSWDPLPGTTVFYQIIFTGPDGVIHTHTLPNNFMSLTGLSPGFAYNFRVQSAVGNTTVVIGTAAANTGPLIPRPAPRDVYFQSHELNYFTVSWTPEDITDVTGYLVAYEAGSAGFQETINDPTATTITLQDDTLGGNPPNGVLIVPFVSGMVNTQYIVQGNEAPLHVLPLEAPTSATVQRTSATSYELRWVSAPGVDGYVISYATTLMRDNTSSREVPLGRTSEQITGLPPNTDFTFYLYSQKNGLRKRAVLTMVSQGSPDTTPPTVLCPSDILRTVPLGSTFAMVAVPLPTVTDDSGIFFFVSSTVPTTNQFPLGTTSVTFTYRDLAFNQASCTLSIFVSITSTDTIPPVVSCPPDVTVTVQLGSTQSEVINVGEPTVSDNSGVVVLVNSTLPAESRFPIGTTAVDFIYRDPANNQASCSLLVSVVEVDTIPPVVICPGTFVATIPAGATSGIITLPSATANDVGGSVTLVSTQPNPTNPFPLGTTNVSYTFRDQFGNRASCSFDVVVSTGTTETGVTVTSVTENSISVSWPQVPNNLIYQILYSDSDRTQINITMTESITLTDLLEGTSYNITVVGFNNSGRVDVGSVIATTAMMTSLTACSSGPCKNLGTCINVQQNSYACICQEGYVGDQCELLAIVGTPFFVSDRGTDFVTVTWEDDPSQSIVSYILTLFDASGTVEVVQQQLVAPEPTLTSQFTGLQPATKYTLDVDVIVGSVRNQFVSGTFYTRPKPPENIILYTLSDEASIIRWDPPSPPDNNFDGYLAAYQDISSGFISAVPLASAVRSHVFDGLQIGVAYDFTVLTTVGQNTASSFTTFPTITLGSPANVSIRAVTAEHVEVAWTVPQVYAQSYMVHLFNEGGTEEHSRTVGAENTSVVFQNLTPSTLYLAVVETVSASSKLSYVSGWDLARTNILTASTLAVAEIGSTSATLSWIPIPSATGYVVSYISQDLSDTGVVELPSPSTTATVSGLRPETIYTFSVVATTTPPTGVGTTVGVTNVLTEVVVDAVTFNTISLSWTNIPDSNFYQIDYRNLGGVVRQTASLTNTTTINGLTPSTSYNITVESFSFGAIRQVVGFVAVSTEMASTAEIVNITVDTVVLTWDPLPGALVYIVTITDGISSNVEQTFASPITISGLTHNTMYEFSVVGYGPMGEVNLGSVSGSTAFDNCASSPCQNGGECVNVLTSFTCQCGLGYFGTLCEIAIQCPIPPMSNALNSFDGSCIGPGLIDNGYSCTYRCALGFLIRGEPTIACQLNGTLDGTFPLCEDVDECRNGLMCEDPNSFCLNNIGSFMCSCNGGFQLMPDGTCQESATISCTPDPCANGGTCVAGFNRVTCLCRPGFTGPACEQNLYCAGVQCGSSQVCVNEQCTCLEGFILQGGLCQSPCSPQCDIETEICVSITGGGFQCDCRPDRERSFWTGLCVPRSRTFSSVFTIDELGGSPVDFNPSFADPTSLAFQEGSDAVTGLLPLAFEAAGMPGVIGIEVGGFFQGSLMCEIIVYVGKEFDGTEIDLKNVLMPNVSSTRFSDGSHEILIRRDSVTVHEITHSDPCSMPELNDCSVNAVCLNEDERAYICLCMEGYKDMFPESLPGRYCMEDKTSTTPSVIDKEPGTGFDKRNIFIGIVSSVAIVILLVLIVFCFNLIRIHREEYKVKKRTAAQEKAIEVKTPEDFVQSSVPDVFFKKSNLDDHTYINPNPQLDKQHPSAFNLDAKNHATTIDELKE
ncbi:fibronectin-like [Lytechinus variegatus]|uniref:fibronectin-like n=1 Tax=Lytechinus variegatus TaxID=7654 RepID=UPI001BB1945A|nr:fibronectin-like [Lytechinus variegatus]